MGKIGIITDSIRNQSTGIGFYSKDIIQEILRCDNKNEYFFMDYLKSNFNKDNLVIIKNPFKYFKTYLWHNYIPLMTRRFNMDYIFNFSACPHFIPFRQKEIFFVYDVSW